MNHQFSILIAIICSLTTGMVSYAQQAVVATGGNISQATGSISYSVGLIPFNKHTTAAGSLTEGLFHIYRIKTSTKVPGTNHFDVSIYPNPTTDRINISINGESAGNMTCIFYDIKGQTLKTLKIHDHENQTLSLSQYNAGIYFLKILRKNTPIETYKIIKQ